MDYLEIADENHVALGRYCGEELVGRDVNVGGNEVVIKFRSDYYFGKRGFLLVFTPVQPCKFKRSFLTFVATTSEYLVWIGFRPVIKGMVKNEICNTEGIFSF